MQAARRLYFLFSAAAFAAFRCLGVTLAIAERRAYSVVTWTAAQRRAAAPSGRWNN